MLQTINWFIKSRRAQNVDDYETWNEGGVVPTLNLGDNTGDTRATVLIFYGNRVDDIRIQGDVINTLQARMGTGGGNMPMVAYPMHGGMVGRKLENGLGGSGFRNDGEASYTLTSSSQSIHGVGTETTVRRLTPVECERLQGFPDDWTDGQTDGHRYKQMGNAVTVNVIEWIGSRL